MNILALEGALGTFSAAVAIDGTIAASQTLGGNVALEAGLGAVSAVLGEAGTSPQRLDRLAVGIGPGGFTGLRITIAYAKSLAQGWGLPLVAIPSFDLLEFGHERPRMLAIVMGRPGIISARYRAAGLERRASGPVAEVLREVLAGTADDQLPVAGAPKDVLDALAEGGIIVEPLDATVTPPAAALALLASSRAPAASIHDVRADYGEAPAARVPAFTKTARPQ
jgi:tRNA threonylcarbamoyladenosine biosynthesis protein TsaB